MSMNKLPAGQSKGIDMIDQGWDIINSTDIPQYSSLIESLLYLKLNLLNEVLPIDSKTKKNR